MTAQTFRNLTVYKKALNWQWKYTSDADMENTETCVWLDFALACGYIKTETWNELELKCEEIGKMLNHIIEFPEKYFRKSQLN